MLLKSIVLTSCIFVAATLQLSAQQTYQTADVIVETVQTPLAIHTGNFTCFRNLNCLTRENILNTRNLVKKASNNRNTNHIVIEGSSKNEDLHAVYNRDGRLIKATVLQRNIPLPASIRNLLISEDFQGWTMIGNELKVKDFKEDRMEYKVVLMRAQEVRVEYFDGKGRHVNRLS
jgi:hypothetical protein